MSEFNSVFADDMDAALDFDTVFSDSTDGDLIDKVCGFKEDGSCETDFDELHQTDDDACPDDIDDELGVGNDTKNAPKGAEGTDSDPNIDLAFGEADEFGCTGVKGENEIDKFHGDIRDEEPSSAETGEGSDVKMDPENIEDEFEKICKEAEELADSDDEGIDTTDPNMDKLTQDECKECGTCGCEDDFGEYNGTVGTRPDDYGTFDDKINNIFSDDGYEEPATVGESTDEEEEDEDPDITGECKEAAEIPDKSFDDFMSDVADNNPDDAEGTHDDAFDDGDYDSVSDSDLIDQVIGRD